MGPLSGSINCKITEQLVLTFTLWINIIVHGCIKCYTGKLQCLLCIVVVNFILNHSVVLSFWCDDKSTTAGSGLFEMQNINRANQEPLPYYYFG